MKNKSLLFLFMTLFFAGIAFMAQAQSDQDDDPEMDKKTPQERAENRTRKLTKELQLNEQQQSQVKEAALVRAQKVDAIRNDAGKQKAQKAQELKAAQDEFDGKMKQILTAEQHTKYLELRSKKIEKIKENKGKGKGRGVGKGGQ